MGSRGAGTPQLPSAFKPDDGRSARRRAATKLRAESSGAQGRRDCPPLASPSLPMRAPQALATSARPRRRPRRGLRLLHPALRRRVMHSSNTLRFLFVLAVTAMGCTTEVVATTGGGGRSSSGSTSESVSSSSGLLSPPGTYVLDFTGCLSGGLELGALLASASQLTPSSLLEPTRFRICIRRLDLGSSGTTTPTKVARSTPRTFKEGAS